MQKALGLDLANMTDDLRKKYKIKDSVKGVVITGVDPSSPRPPTSGSSPATSSSRCNTRRSAIRPTCRSRSISSRAGKKSAVLLVSNAEGETRFVALSLQ